MRPILIDPKGDPALVERARHEALARSRAFYCFSLDSPRDHWNPLVAGTPSEKADKLIGAEEWTEPHYKRLYQRYLLNLFLAIEAHGETAHLGLVVELLNPDRLAMYCRAIDGAVAAERLAGYLEDLTTDARRQLSGLRNRLALLTESEHGAQLQPPAQPENGVDLALAIAQQAVVVFSLNSARYPETVKLLGSGDRPGPQDRRGEDRGRRGLRPPRRRSGRRVRGLRGRPRPRALPACTLSPAVAAARDPGAG